MPQLLITAMLQIWIARRQSLFADAQKHLNYAGIVGAGRQFQCFLHVGDDLVVNFVCFAFAAQQKVDDLAVGREKSLEGMGLVAYWVQCRTGFFFDYRNHGIKLTTPETPMCRTPSSCKCCKYSHVSSASAYFTPNTKSFMIFPRVWCKGCNGSCSAICSPSICTNELIKKLL